MNLRRILKAVIIGGMLVFLPPVGIFLVFKKTHWTNRTKIIVSILATLWLIFIIYAVVTAPPTINMNIKETGNQAIEADSINLDGRVNPTGAILTINTVPVTADKSGHYNYTVKLHEGDNSIAVVAKDADKITTKNYHVHRLTSAEIAKLKADAAHKKEEEARKKAAAEAAKISAQKKADADKAAKQKQEAEAAAKKSKDAAAKAAAAQKKTTTTTKSNTKTTTTTQAKPQTTMDKLWIALDKSLKTRSGMDIKWNEQTKIAELHYSNKDFWDEKAVVSTAYKQFVLWGKQVVTIPGVETIETHVATEFIDSYGNKNMNDAVTIYMQVPDFNKFNWNNLEGYPIHNQLRSTDLGSMYIAPAISKKINLDDIKLYY